MANLMKDAARQLRAQNDKIKAFRAAHAVHERDIVHGITAVGAAALGGLVDAKWKADDGGPAAVKGIPVNAAAGVVLLGASMIPGLPGAGLVGSAGLGLVEISLYRYITDNVVFEQKPAQ